MTRQLFVSFVVFACSLMSAPRAARADDAPRAVDAPRLVANDTSHDFGRVSRGTVVARSFVIRNPGTADLRIESMQFSAPGMRARVPAAIGPGSSAELKVEWD